MTTPHRQAPRPDPRNSPEDGHMSAVDGKRGAGRQAGPTGVNPNTLVFVEPLWLQRIRRTDPTEASGTGNESQGPTRAAGQA